MTKAGKQVPAALAASYEQLRQDAGRVRQAHNSWFRRNVDMLAYPFGAYNSSLIKAARAEGIQFAFTVKPGLVSRGTPNMELPRLNAGVRGMTGKQVVNLIRKYAPTGGSPVKIQSKPIGYYVGGGFYRTLNEAQKAAKKFTKATGYKMYVTKHPSRKGYWVQSGRISDHARAQYLARKWARLGLRYVVRATN